MSTSRISVNVDTQKSYKESLDHEYILSELAKAELEAANPSTKWLTHEEIMANVARRREARKHSV